MIIVWHNLLYMNQPLKSIESDCKWPSNWVKVFTLECKIRTCQIQQTDHFSKQLNFYFPFVQVRHCSQSLYGRSTGNDVSGRHSYHSLFSDLPPRFFPPSFTFLIEGIKNLLSESWWEGQKIKECTSYWPPSAINPLQGGGVLTGTDCSI